jgi:hypothetical protein
MSKKQKFVAGQTVKLVEFPPGICAGGFLKIGMTGTITFIDQSDEFLPYYVGFKKKPVDAPVNFWCQSENLAAV